MRVRRAGHWPAGCAGPRPPGRDRARPLPSSAPFYQGPSWPVRATIPPSRRICATANEKCISLTYRGGLARTSLDDGAGSTTPSRAGHEGARCREPINTPRRRAPPRPAPASSYELLLRCGRGDEAAFGQSLRPVPVLPGGRRGAGPRGLRPRLAPRPHVRPRCSGSGRVGDGPRPGGDSVADGDVAGGDDGGPAAFLDGHGRRPVAREREPVVRHPHSVAPGQRHGDPGPPRGPGC